MANISTTVNIDILEKLPNGSYKKKNPSTTKAQVGLGNVDNVQQASKAEFDAHKADNTTIKHKAKTIALESSNFTSTNVETGMNELFTNVSNGKQVIATAITGKEVPTSSSDTFNTMASNIGRIKVGDYSIGDKISPTAFETTITDPVREWSIEATFGITGDTRPLEIRYLSTDKYSNAYAYSVRPGTFGKVDKNSNMIWGFSTSFYPNSSRSDSLGNTYLGDQGGVLRKINNKGEIIYAKSIASNAISALYPSPDGYIYAAARSDLKKLSYDGTQIWSITLSNTIYGVTCDDNGDIHCTIYGHPSGQVSKVKSNGSVAWTRDMGGASDHITVNKYNEVFVTERVPSLVKLDGNNGSAVWTITNEFGRLEALDTDCDDNIIAAGRRVPTRKIGRNGVEIWSTSLASGGYSVSVGGYGDIYVGRDRRILSKITDKGMQILK